MIYLVLYAIALVCGAACWWLDFFGGWSFFVGFFSFFLLMYIYEYLAPFGPLWLQRPLYRAWKQKIQQIETHPLIAYPFHVYITLQLDGEFEKGGMRQAKKAASEWLKRYPDRFAGAVIAITKKETP